MEKEELKKIIEDNRDAILKGLADAFCSAVDNYANKYNVELYRNGHIEVWGEVSGSQHFKESNMTGESITIGSFDGQSIPEENDEKNGETVEEWKEWYKSNYRWEEADRALDRFEEENDLI